MATVIQKLIGIHLLAFVTSNSKFAVEKDPVTKFLSNEIRAELKDLVGVKGGIGGSVTLTSDSFLGAGTISFVLPGVLADGTPVAIKFMNDSSEYFAREYNCFEKMNATVHKQCEKFGIPFIYHTGNFLNFKTIAMTLLDTDLQSLHKKVGPFSEDSILILFKDLVRTSKYMHSKGVINEDIKPENVLIRGANVFLSDFNQCDLRALRNRPNRGNPYFMSIAVHMGESPAEYDDLQSLFYTMLVLADVELPWRNLIDRKEIMESKQRTIGESLCKEIKHSAVIQPCTEFYDSVMESAYRKRLPEYDSLYKAFDDALYNNQNRSERIVFEWLTTEEKLEAVAEDLPSIESIKFSKISFLF
ncbi:casein kinase I-like [Bradysia coprophila]|uniref:casein kinase I-like n=1 Tax=Bradysia coprophila TaxID=38358 RepID=UPI00187D707E|nr:casein kinase I-like [Bradysia coprophila]